MLRKFKNIFHNNKNSEQEFISKGHSKILNKMPDLKDYRTEEDCGIFISKYNNSWSIESMSQTFIEAGSTETYSSEYLYIDKRVFITRIGYHVEITGGNGEEWNISSIEN